MQERAERIGARLRVLSRRAAGTEIELLVPGHLAYQPQPGQRRPWREIASRYSYRNATIGSTRDARRAGK
jgi:hypothetical protein